MRNYIRIVLFSEEFHDILKFEHLSNFQTYWKLLIMNHVEEIFKRIRLDKDYKGIKCTSNKQQLKT